MSGLGTLINTAGIVLSGLSGYFFGSLLNPRHQKSIMETCGISVMFIGIAGAMEGMLSINNSVINSGQSMLVTICLALGTLIGELINIEGQFENFGEWLKIKTGNAKDKDFVNAFVTASLTVCLVLWLYFGYLYRRYGIAYAKMVHGSTHLIFDVTMIVVFIAL